MDITGNRCAKVHPQSESASDTSSNLLDPDRKLGFADEDRLGL